MSHTYAANFIHCVFSTKDRAKIIPESKQQTLWAYLVGIAVNIGIGVLAVGGSGDHVHMLLALPPDKKLAEVVRDLRQIPRGG